MNNETESNNDNPSLPKGEGVPNVSGRLGLYTPYLKKYARENRKNMTKGETWLWTKLKGKQLDGLKFRRQVPMGNFIADFYCHEFKLVIEVQGYSHLLPTVIESDKIKHKWLHENGFNILEIDDNTIFNDLDNAINEIREKIMEIQGN